MAWDAKYPNFGVLKLDSKKTTVEVYSDRHNYLSLNLGSGSSNEAVSANWIGNKLNVVMKSGKVRLYKDRHDYDLI